MSNFIKADILLFLCDYPDSSKTSSELAKTRLGILIQQQQKCCMIESSRWYYRQNRLHDRCHMCESLHLPFLIQQLSLN
jgi:hypothetical protein